MSRWNDTWARCQRDLLDLASAAGRGFLPARWDSERKAYMADPAATRAHRVVCCFCGHDLAVGQRAYQARHLRAKHEQAGVDLMTGYYLERLFDALRDAVVPFTEQRLARAVAEAEAAQARERELFAREAREWGQRGKP